MQAIETTRALAGAPYEKPQLEILGTVQDLTQFCLFGKALGTPDYFEHIPISNCSA